MAADLVTELRFAAVDTPLGSLTIATTENGVVATTFRDDDLDAMLAGLERALGTTALSSPRELASVRREVNEYFEGVRRILTTPVDLRLAGGGFDRRVLEATAAIPYGELVTYGDVAAAAGSPRGGRAAGNALSRSPMELWIPCHRVVHASGTIGGYGRHEERKRWLLHHERSI